MSIGGDSPKHSPGRNVPAIGPQRSNPSDDNPSAAPAFEGRGCSQRYRRTTTVCRRFPHAEPELSVPEGRNRKIFVYLGNNRTTKTSPYGKLTPSENGRTRRMAPSRRRATPRPSRSLREAARRDTPHGGIARRLRQRPPVFRLAVRLNARRVVVPRMAARRLRRLPVRRLQRLATHRTASGQRRSGGMEHLPARGSTRSTSTAATAGSTGFRPTPRA